MKFQHFFKKKFKIIRFLIFPKIVFFWFYEFWTKIALQFFSPNFINFGYFFIFFHSKFLSFIKILILCCRFQMIDLVKSSNKPLHDKVLTMWAQSKYNMGGVSMDEHSKKNEETWTKAKQMIGKEGWTSKGVNQGIDVYIRTEGGVCAAKGIKTMNVPLDHVIEALVLHFEERKLWDVNMVTNFLLEDNFPSKKEIWILLLWHCNYSFFWFNLCLFFYVFQVFSPNFSLIKISLLFFRYQRTSYSRCRAGTPGLDDRDLVVQSFQRSLLPEENGFFAAAHSLVDDEKPLCEVPQAAAWLRACDLPWWMGVEDAC